MYKDLFVFYVIGISTTTVVTAIIYYISLIRNFRISSWVFYIVIVLSLYIPIAQYFKYISLHFYVDFSHWMQILYNISTNGLPFSLNQNILSPGTTNYLSVHFVPLLYIIALPFKLWSYSETAIVLNFLLMFSSVIPLYKLALICNKDKQFSLFLVVLFLWYPTFQYLVLYEFEMLRFSIPIILWMLYFWEKRSIKMYFLFVFLAVLVREEVGLTIMMFGLYLLLIKNSRLYGLATVIMGLGAFVVITQIIMPALRTTSDYTNYKHVAAGSFGVFGNTFGEIAINIIRHPLQTLTAISQPIKFANLFMFFFPLIFVPLLTPTVLISTFASFSIGMLSSSITHISYMLYYMSPGLPFIFYAFIKGWPRFLRVLGACSYRSFAGRKNGNSFAAMAMVLTGIMFSNVFFGTSPISLQFWFKDIRPAPFKTQDFHYSVYQINDHHRKVEEFNILIPDTAIVSAPQHLHPRLFKKKAAMVYPRLESNDGKYKADYVFFDKTNNGLRKESPVYLTQDKFDIVEKDVKNWTLIKSKSGFFLYKRVNGF